MGGPNGIEEQRQFEAICNSLEIDKGQQAAAGKFQSSYARRKAQKLIENRNRKINSVNADKRVRSGHKGLTGGGPNSVLQNARGRHDKNMSTRLRSAYQTPSAQGINNYLRIGSAINNQ
jgi:hypothetical protein